MFGRRVRLFRIFGFDVRLDASWLFLFLIVTWSLSLGIFPARFPDLPFRTYLLLGVGGALGLFSSIVFHELSHSLVASRFGLRMKGITLFLLGGVAEMPEEPGRPAAEFWMAIAGPAASLVLAAAFLGLFRAGEALGMPPEWNGIVGYLSVVNLVLAVFNLIPAFPLDGGRMLRAALWASTGDQAQATRIASGIGIGFGLLLLIFGAVRILGGNLLGGAWWMLIGLFIRMAARSSAVRLAQTRALKGEAVRRFMQGNAPAVSPELPLRRLVEEYIYRFNLPTFPVLHNGHVAGCIGLQQVKSVPREQWEVLRVADAMTACPMGSVVSPDLPMDAALKHMHESGTQVLMAVEDGRLLGILTVSDILRFASIRQELEAAAEAPRVAEGAGSRVRTDLTPPGEPLPA